MVHNLLFAMAAAASVSAIGGDALDGTDWICPAGFSSATNATIELRCEFAAEADGEAELSVSADAVYAVRLNGNMAVATARLPDVPPHRYFDVWKLEGVRAGTNALELSLYSPGVDTSHFRAGDPGLRFSLSVPGCRVTSSGPMQWRPSTADRAEGVPLLSRQLGFTFEHDAAAKPAKWREVTAAERRAHMAGETRERRPVRPTETLPFVAARLIGEGRLDGSPVPPDAAEGMDATKMRTAKLGVPVTAENFGDGFWYLFDVGREEVGLLEMELETDAGVVVDVGHAEHSEDGRIRASIGHRHFAGRYRAREGRQTFRRWQYRMAGRYLQLHVRGVKTRFVLHRVGMCPTIRTDVEERQAPVHLTAREVEIWKTAVRTLRLSMHEHYEDCPWREQSLYANDARNQMLAGRHAFAHDGKYAAHCLDLLARGLGENDGWIELCMPARIRITIPSFTFAWALMAADHLRIYGDREAAVRNLPMMKAIIRRRLAERREGLLPCPAGPRYWQFYDWVPGLDGDKYLKNGELRFDAPLNLFFLQSLEACAVMADALGEKASASEWRAAASDLREAVREKFWNTEERRFYTYAAGHAGPNAHELTQALALLTDAVPPEAWRAVATKLGAPSDWVETTLSQSLHKYEALVRAGPEFGRMAVRHMDETWGRMLDAGATSFWETKEGWRAFGDAGSLCHGWSAVPEYFYGAHPELFGAHSVR